MNPHFRSTTSFTSVHLKTLWIILFFVGLHVVPLVAQKLDLSKYQTTKEKIEFLQQHIGDYGRNGQFSEVIQYSRLGIALAQKAKVDSAIAKFNYFIGSAYSAQNQTDSALYYFRKAEKTASVSGASTILLRSRIQLVYTYDMLGITDSAFAILKKAKQTAQKMNNKKFQGDLEILQANLNVHKGEYNHALQAYIRAYHNYEFISDSSDMAAALEGISLVEQNLNNIPKSLSYTHEALLLFTKLNHIDRVNNCYQILGDLHLKMSQYDSATYYYQKVTEVSQTLNENYLPGKAYQGLAVIAEKRDKPALAEKYLLKALQIIQKTEIKSSIAEVQLALGRFYFQQKKFEKAKLHFQQGLQTKIESKHTAESIAAYQLLAQTEAQLKNFSKAYYYQNLYSTQLDSLQIQNNAKELAEVEARYQVDRKQQQIALLNEKNRSQNLELALQQRNQIILAVVVGVIALIGFVSYRRFRLRKKLEMEQIRNRIAADFHDELGANLSSIALYSDLLLKNPSAEKEKSLPILATISQQAHGSISSIHDLIWTIKADNDVLERTIVRMKEFAIPLLEARNIRFTFLSEDSLSSEKLTMNMRKFIYLIFKESINNAVKYAHATAVTVQLRQTTGQMVLEIQDDGIGFDPATVKRGNGLNNMQNRAIELGGKLWIDSAINQGTCIRLTFKLA